MINVAILGDSRVFDTYYLNAAYDAGYGMDATFPFLMRRACLSNPADPAFDVVHIPDHFRGGAVETNILRLALTRPGGVILCDGIWETLLNKEMFLDYVQRRVAEHGARSGRPLAFEYSTAELARLFVAGELPVSPQGYARDIRRLASFFRRRRRKVWWMNLVVPPADYLTRVHYAGNYRCIPEWGACLDAVNAAVAEALAPIGGAVVDVDALCRDHGGPEAALIDQWHYAPSFHVRLAEHLDALLRAEVAAMALPDDHASHRFIVPGAPLDDTPVAVWGTGTAAGAWLEAHPKARVEAVIADTPDAPHHFWSVPVKSLETIAADGPRVVILPGDEGPAVDAAEEHLLNALPRDHIVLRPAEEALVNPRRPAGARGAP